MNNDNQDMHAPMNGDDDLAKALNGDMNFEETPMPGAHDDSSHSHDDSSTNNSFDDVTTKADDKPPTLEPAAPQQNNTDSTSPELEKIRTSAIGDLRPLIGKLDLPAEEKFDTLLLFIRSTDDVSLLQETYDAAKAIEDEGKRAKALLDVVREVSYFSNKK